MNKKTLIFDLDGTLIDSLEDIALCMNEVLKSLNLKTHKIEDYKYFVGGGVDILVQNCLDENIDKELKQKVTSEFKRVYDQELHNNTKPYEGIYELLDELNGKYNLAILSNKPHEFTLAYANKFFSKYNFLEVHGQKKDVPKKPDATAASNIAKNIGVKNEDCFFIGDTLVDMQTAKNANMIGIGVLWGFRDEKELLDNGALHLVTYPSEIVEILNNYN